MATPAPCVWAFDSETRPFGPGNLTPAPIVVSIANEEGSALLTPAEGADWLAERFAARDVLVGHNAAYDVAVMANAFPKLLPAIFKAYELGCIKDTLVRAKLIDIADCGAGYYTGPDGLPKKTGYSLKDQAKRHLNLELAKGDDTWRTRYQELEGVHLELWPDAAREYALLDAEVTLKVYRAQGGDITDENAQTRAAFALHMLSVNGMAADPVAVQMLKAQLTKQSESDIEKLIELGFMRAPKWMPKAKRYTEPTKDVGAIRAAVQEAYARNKKRVPLTDKKQVSTDEKTLCESGCSKLKVLADSAGTQKLLTTYVPVLEQPIINARFNVLVDSGRTSCSGPNLQNLPKIGGVREALVPRPGHLFLSVDYDTLELRCLAQACLWLIGHSAMAAALQEGKDLHLDFAAQLLGVPYSKAVALKKSNDPRIKQGRTLGKIFNFGKPGGMSDYSLIDYASSYGAETVEHLSKVVGECAKCEGKKTLPGWGKNRKPRPCHVCRGDGKRREAHVLGEVWINRWEEMPEYFARVRENLTEEMAIFVDGKRELKKVGRFVQLLSGRVRGKTGYTEGCNTYFQGLAADGAKRALYRVVKESMLPGHVISGCKPVAFIHDEVLVEVPEARAHEMAMEVVRILEEEMKTVLPDIPVTCSPALMRRWEKEAEAVHHNGRLVPWSRP